MEAELALSFSVRAKVEVGAVGNAFQFLQARVGGTGGHTNLDFFDTVPLDHLQKNAVIMAVFVYHAAIAQDVLPRRCAR